MLLPIAATWPLIYGSAVVGTSTAVPADHPTAAMLGLVTLAVGLGTVALIGRKLPAGLVAGLVAAAPLPVLVAAAGIDGWAGGALAAVAALTLGGFALPWFDRAVRLTAASAAMVALLIATATALHGSTLTLVLLGEAVAAAVLSRAMRGRFAFVAATALGGIATLIALVRDLSLVGLVWLEASPFVEVGGARIDLLVTGIGVALLLGALATLLLLAGGRLGWIRPDARSAALWAPIGLTGLYAATGLVIATVLLIAPDRTGFTIGHALVTVSWTIAALVLLAKGIRRPVLRIVGMVLVISAVAKLVLFDLVTLDGLARVGAFLGAGLVLLAAGARYARLVAEAERDDAPAAEAPSPAPSGPPAG
jgi:uncharacterized membrane protein